MLSWINKVRVSWVLLIIFLGVIVGGNAGWAAAPITIKVDGRQVASDVAPWVDANNRVMVPMRFIAESLGYKVDWQPAVKQVTVRSERVVKLWVGNILAEIDNTSVAMDTIPVIAAGRTMVPLRFVSEAMGARVSWESSNRQVTVVTTPPQVEEGRIALVTGGSSLDPVNIRQGPGTTYPVVTKALPGQEIRVAGEVDGWLQVLEPVKGYIADWLVDSGLPELPSRGDTGSVINPLLGKVILLDPGHGSVQPGGWSDPGAVGQGGLYERDVVMDIAFKLTAELERQGATVVLTRTGNTTLTLAGRAQMASDAGADVFISIHANANVNPLIAGTSTYTYTSDPVQDQTYLREKLAGYIQEELVRSTGRRNIGVLKANFAVLRLTTVPAVLVETAFVSNLEEEKLLADPDFRERLALGIARGLGRYFGVVPTTSGNDSSGAGTQGDVFASGSDSSGAVIEGDVSAGNSGQPGGEESSELPSETGEDNSGNDGQQAGGTS